MKIENSGLTPISPKKTDGVQPGDKKKAASAALPAATPAILKQDSAQVTDSARLLAKARAALDETADPRADRVAALQEQVQNGKYEIPYDELAARLAAHFNRSA